MLAEAAAAAIGEAAAAAASKPATPQLVFLLYCLHSSKKISGPRLGWTVFRSGVTPFIICKQNKAFEKTRIMNIIFIHISN